MTKVNDGTRHTPTMKGNRNVVVHAPYTHLTQLQMQPIVYDAWITTLRSSLHGAERPDAKRRWYALSLAVTFGRPQLEYRTHPTPRTPVSGAVPQRAPGMYSLPTFEDHTKLIAWSDTDA